MQGELLEMTVSVPPIKAVGFEFRNRGGDLEICFIEAGTFSRFGARCLGEKEACEIVRDFANLASGQ